MTAFIIILVLLILLAAVLYWAFSVAFLRRQSENLENLDAPQNNFLQPYRREVEEGMRFIDEQPFEAVTIYSFDGLRLWGRYYKNGDSNRTILLFHGYRSSAKRDFSCAVKMYYRMGLNILLADQRCHGNSEGKIITFGVKESWDVISWVDFVLKEYGDRLLFLDGLSMGATTVMLATRFRLPENVKGIIADCGFTSPAEIIGEVAERNFHVSRRIAVPVLNFLCRIFAGFDLKELSTVNVLRESDIPIFLVHGKSDGFVPFSMTERSYAAARGKKDMYLVEGADHGMSFLTDNKGVTERLNKFISENSEK